MNLTSLLPIRISTTLALALFAVPALPQTKSKLVNWPKNPGSRIKHVGQGMRLLPLLDSFKIEDIAVEGKSITVGQPFIASDDWLNAITVRVKNISQQPFSMIQMTVILPEISISPDIPVCYGCDDAEKKKGIAPGEEVALKSFGGKFYDWLKVVIAQKSSLSSITTAQIRDTVAVLPDGTMLISECVKTVDPRNACLNHTAP